MTLPTYKDIQFRVNRNAGLAVLMLAELQSTDQFLDRDFVPIYIFNELTH